MPNFFKFNEDINLEGFTFLLGSVSVGNVAQLTIDLFITTLKLRKIGSVWHPALIPCVGSDPYYDSTEICTACELFIDKEHQIITMQLRSALEPRHALHFFKEMKKELDSFKLRRMLLLTSVFDFELHTVDSNRFFYISDSDNVPETFGTLKKINKDSGGNYFLNGSGFAVKFYEMMNCNQCFIIGKYVSEGDNRPDAISMLMKMLPLLNIDTQNVELRFPSSWQYVFGGPPPIGIF